MADLARRAAQEGLSVRAVEELVRSGRDGRKRSDLAASPRTRDPHLRHLESELQRQLGTAVRIHLGKGATGRIEIPFFGTDDFERVTELLLGSDAGRF